jgi:hypothetical protein
LRLQTLSRGVGNFKRAKASRLFQANYIFEQFGRIFSAALISHESLDYWELADFRDLYRLSSNLNDYV